MISLLLHLDQNLIWLIQQYGVWIYPMIFIVIFCETGLVFIPFLPGDTLLFLIGALSATGLIDLKLAIAVTIIAAILGDSVNYSIGKMMGPHIFRSENSRWFNKKNIQLAERFYERYGAKALVLARFTPIIRTFAPFVAGIGQMNYRKFLAWNISGAILWVMSITLIGYIFGNIPFVKNNLTLMILVIVLISLIPAWISYLQEHKKND